MRARGDEASARLDRAARRRAAGAPRACRAELDAARLDDDVLAAVRALAAGGGRVLRGAAAARDVALEAVAGRASRSAAGCRSRRSAIYVPGGRAAYPVLARDGRRARRGSPGVERIAVVTPRPAEATLAVARELGIDEVYAVGGAQAVAALAYGTETIAPVDKIVGPGNRWVTAAKLLVSSRGRDRPAGRAERGRPDRRRDRRRGPVRRRPARAGRARPRQRGDPARARRRALPPRSTALVAGAQNVSRRATSPTSTRRSPAPRPTRRSTRALGRGRRSRCATRVRNAGTVFVRTSAVVGDYAAGATHVLPTGGLARGCGRARARELPQAGSVRLRDARSSARAEIGLPLARVEGLPLHAAALELAMRPRAARRRASAPYEWSPSSADVAARHGLRPEQVLRFDQNTPPLPGVPQVPLAESFARLQRVPGRHLRASCARRPPSYSGVEPEQIVVGAGADELIAALRARPSSAPGRRAAIYPPTYGLYRIASQLEGAEVVTEPGRRRPDLGLQPEQPDRRAARSGRDRRARARSPAGGRRRRRGVLGVRRRRRVSPLVAELPNLIVLRTLSKAFGFAALRVGYAVAARRRRRRSSSGAGRRRASAAPAARIAAAALREPRLDIAATVAERERVRAALVAAGYDCPETPRQLRLACARRTARRAPRGGRGSSCAIFAEGIRITLRRPPENDVLLRSARRDRRAVARAQRRSSRARAPRRRCSLSLDLDGVGPRRASRPGSASSITC